MLGSRIDGCKLEDGVVEYTFVEATYACPNGEVVVELAHVSLADEKDTQTQHFAIAVLEGSPPPALVDKLAKSVHDREDRFVWTMPAPPAAPQPAVDLAARQRLMARTLAMRPSATTLLPGPALPASTDAPRVQSRTQMLPQRQAPPTSHAVCSRWGSCEALDRSRRRGSPAGPDVLRLVKADPSRRALAGDRDNWTRAAIPQRSQEASHLRRCILAPSILRHEIATRLGNFRSLVRTQKHSAAFASGCMRGRKKGASVMSTSRCTTETKSRNQSPQPSRTSNASCQQRRTI